MTCNCLNITCSRFSHTLGVISVDKGKYIMKARQQKNSMLSCDLRYEKVHVFYLFIYTLCTYYMFLAHEIGVTHSKEKTHHVGKTNKRH